MNSDIAIAGQSISSLFYKSYNPEADANCAAWLPCKNTICQELTNKNAYEVKLICQSKNFTDIHSHFLQNITKLKDLISVYIDNEGNKKAYAEKIDVFYDKIKDHDKINDNQLTPLFNHTCRQICRIVLTLEQYHSEGTDSKNPEKTKHNFPLKKEEIVVMLTDLTDDIDTCLPGVQTRFQHTYEQLEAIRNQSNLPSQIANIKTQLLKSYTQEFMHQQSRMQELDISDDMEIHYFNYFNNLVYQRLGCKPIDDLYRPSSETVGSNVDKVFVLQALLHVNSFTIINKFVEQWSEQLSNILEQNGLSAWLEKAIPDKKLTAEYTDVISSQFIEPINYLFANEASEPLTLHDLFEIDESYTTYSLVDFKEKLTAFAAQVFFGKDTTQIISKLPGKQGESLCIGTTDKNFFWVFENNSSSNAAQALNRDNYTALQLSHLKTIDFNNLDEHTHSALLIQALEQTDNIDDVTSFFLDKKILKTLQNLPPAARQTIFTQLDNKISACTQDQKDTAIKSIVNHLTTLASTASTNKQPLQLKDLDCWIDTSLLEPLLCHLKENQMDISAITTALNSSQVDTFSHQGIKLLFLEEQCIELIEQAYKFEQIGLINQLLLTEYFSEQISNQKVQKALLELFAKKGSISGLEYLLGKINTIIDYKDGDNTPLHLAAEYGHTHCIKLLLENNCIDVNCRDPLNDTALHIALKQGFTELAELLINHADIEVNKEDSLEYTALHLAVHKGQTACVKLLLTKRDININQAGSHGYTPLHCAATKGKIDCLKLLLAKTNLQIDAANNEHTYTALHLAVINNKTECVKLLLDESDVTSFFSGNNIITTLQNLPLAARQTILTQLDNKISACTQDQKDTAIKSIVNHLTTLASTNKQPLQLKDLDCWIDTSLLEPLLCHLKENQMDISAITTDLNSSQVDTFSHQGIKLLFLEEQCIELIKQAYKFEQIGLINQLLLTEYFSEQISNQKVQKALLELFAKKGSISGLEYLLGKINTIIDYKDGDNTPLHLAAEYGHTHCVKLLIEKNFIDVNCLDAQRCTPLHLAILANHTECIELLLANEKTDINAKSINDYTALHLAVIHHQTKCVASLINKSRTNINAKITNGNTALHIAAMNGYSDIVALLTNMPNINVNQPNLDGQTALHLATNTAHPDCVRWLITKADINQLTRENWTALHIAASGSTEVHTQCIELLLAKDNIHINVPTNEGWNATAIAYINNNYKSFKLLEKHINLKTHSN